MAIGFFKRKNIEKTISNILSAKVCKGVYDVTTEAQKKKRLKTYEDLYDKFNTPFHSATQTVPLIVHDLVELVVQWSLEPKVNVDTKR